MADWDPLCKHCEAFDSLVWKTPPRVTRIARVDKNTDNSSLSSIDEALDDSVRTIDVKPNAAS